MLELTSSAATISSEMFSDSKLVIFCGRLLSKTLKSSGFNPLTNRPSPSVTTAVNCTTSTSTASLNFTPLVCTLAAIRPPCTCSAVTRTVCSMTRSPASQSHSNGKRVSGADLATVGEEHDFLDLLVHWSRFDHGDHPDEPAQELVVDGRGDAHGEWRGLRRHGRRQPRPRAPRAADGAASALVLRAGGFPTTQPGGAAPPRSAPRCSRRGCPG